jgi:hypothetical protein
MRSEISQRQLTVFVCAKTLQWLRSDREEKQERKCKLYYYNSLFDYFFVYLFVYFIYCSQHFPLLLLVCDGAILVFF